MLLTYLFHLCCSCAYLYDYATKFMEVGLFMRCRMIMNRVLPSQPSYFSPNKKARFWHKTISRKTLSTWREKPIVRETIVRGKRT